MAAKKVLVEIALSSNDLILGVKGSRHPLRTYLKYGVPVALVTDDAGVSRSTLTLEFRKAVEEQGARLPDAEAHGAQLDRLQLRRRDTKGASADRSGCRVPRVRSATVA